MIQGSNARGEYWRILAEAIVSLAPRDKVVLRSKPVVAFDWMEEYRAQDLEMPYCPSVPYFSIR